MPPPQHYLALCILAAGSFLSAAPVAQAEPLAAGPALVQAYPDFLDRVDGSELVWRDGTRMPIDDGSPAKPLDAMLDHPDLKDMFSMPYPAGEKGIPPAVDFDPGRVRYGPLFQRMYGDCHAPRFMSNAVPVDWLPTRSGKKLKFTKINGAAQALQMVSAELDKLPSSFMEYLMPPAGTYNCRSVAATDRLSPHAYGIAIDINASKADYWQWAKKPAGASVPYQNHVPLEIVDIFERHGFIWGGKWYHYDTMHFEYRPEIIATAR